MGTRSRCIRTGQGSSWLPALRRAVPYCCLASSLQTQWSQMASVPFAGDSWSEIQAGQGWAGFCQRLAEFNCSRAGPRAALATGSLGFLTTRCPFTRQLAFRAGVWSSNDLQATQGPVGYRSHRPAQVPGRRRGCHFLLLDGRVRLPLRESTWVSGSAKLALGHSAPPSSCSALWVPASQEDLPQL